MIFITDTMLKKKVIRKDGYFEGSVECVLKSTGKVLWKNTTGIIRLNKMDAQHDIAVLMNDFSSHGLMF